MLKLDHQPAGLITSPMPPLIEEEKNKSFFDFVLGACKAPISTCDGQGSNPQAWLSRLDNTVASMGPLEIGKSHFPVINRDFGVKIGKFTKLCFSSAHICRRVLKGALIEF